MTDEDRYRYHAYNYGWQRVRLGRMDTSEPLDPDGAWYAANMAARTEEFYRKKFKMKPRYRSPPMPHDQTVVRPNWPQIHIRDLTKAERKLAQERIDALIKRMRTENPRASATAEAMMNRALGVQPAREIAPP